MEVVAHRGVPTGTVENTLPAFQQAVDMGADVIELDVRLTADHVPVIYHYFYLDEITTLSGPIFNYTFEQLQAASIFSDADLKIPSFDEALTSFGGQIGLEIELKGPEPEAAEIIADVLHNYRHLWDTIEVTSYEPALLLDIRNRCPGLMVDLLFPRSENWMRLDVVAYLAINRSRLAQARAVHLHPSQLAPEVVSAVRGAGIEVHAWDINDELSLGTALELAIPRICTDQLQLMLDLLR